MIRFGLVAHPPSVKADHPLLDPRIAKFIVVCPTGCWIWGGATVRGYGEVRSHDGRTSYAHRYIYEWVRGPIAAGLQLDHLCRVPLCVNPSHLEPVTNWENTLRSSHPMAAAARRTHCIHGHSLADAYLRNGHGRGLRNCRTCSLEYSRRRYRKPTEQARRQEPPAGSLFPSHSC
jgi:hypothetical protein